MSPILLQKQILFPCETQILLSGKHPFSFQNMTQNILLFLSWIISCHLLMVWSKLAGIISTFPFFQLNPEDMQYHLIMHALFGFSDSFSIIPLSKSTFILFIYLCFCRFFFLNLCNLPLEILSFTFPIYVYYKWPIESNC